MPTNKVTTLLRGIRKASEETDLETMRTTMAKSRSKDVQKLTKAILDKATEETK